MLARAAFAASAAVAATILVPALTQADTITVRYTSTVAAVNVKTNTLTFTDRTVATVDKSVPVTSDLIGKTVEVGTRGDEDGNIPATEVRVIN